MNTTDHASANAALIEEFGENWREAVFGANSKTPDNIQDAQDYLNKLLSFDDSKYANLHHVPANEKSRKIINELADDLMGTCKFKGQKANQRKHLSFLLMELYLLHWNSDKDALTYIRNTDFYAKLNKDKKRISKLNPNGITASICNVVDTLAACGYLETIPGYIHNTTKDKVPSKLKPTDKLTSIFVPAFNEAQVAITLHKDAPLVQVRDSSGHLVPFTSPVIKDMESILKEYNNLIGNTDICVEDHDIGPVKNLTRSYRVFNNSSIEKGGRFYGPWWQSGIKKGLREHILINGNPTVELDFSAQHPNILYGLALKAPRNSITDFYDLGPDWVRKAVKPAVLFSLNTRTAYKADLLHMKALKKIKQAYRDEGEEVPFDSFADNCDYFNIVEEFYKQYPLLEQYRHTKPALDLQYIDSQIAEAILKALTAQDIPALCIHDSFIVEEQYEAILTDLMYRAGHLIGMPYLMLPIG